MSSGANPFCASWIEGSYAKHFLEIIMNLGRLFRRRCRLFFSIFLNSGGHFVQRSKTICKILKEGIIRNIPVQLF